MELIMVDIPQWKELENPQRKVFTPTEGLRACIGCFGCWVKTPGQCVLQDGYQDLGHWLGKCDKLTLVSQCTYGSFSPGVKNLMDRSISYISPHFVMREGAMHHKRRYDNVLQITAIFYGAQITDQERETARALVAGNALNFDAKQRVLFVETPQQAREALL